MRIPLIAGLTVLQLATRSVAAPATPPPAIAITVDAGSVLRTHDRRLLIGTNIAMWTDARTFANPEVKQWVRDLRTPLIRIPGGSWGDGTFWNGNGVRRPDGTVDPSKVGPDGYPAIDYAGYAPAITVDNLGKIKADGWHGNVDVKVLHDWVREVGARAVVIVNGGTGRPRDAAEWVKWAKANRYAVDYWEVGNELDGSWEAGSTQPDGTRLTASEYADRYVAFVRAMKAVDPTIRIAPAAVGYRDGSFGDAVFRTSPELVDVFPIHAYPVLGMDPEDLRFAKVADAGRQPAEVREQLRKVAPAHATRIPITFTEWNMGLQNASGSGELESALWAALWVGEMFAAGVESANAWDLFTQGLDADGGFAMILPSDPPVRKGMYWAFWLWSHWMGDSLLSSTVTGSETLRIFATKADDAVYVMAVNRDWHAPARARVTLSGFDAGAAGALARLSFAEYFWNAPAKRPQWSRSPTVTALRTGAAFDLVVPPYAMVVAKVPARTAPPVKVAAAPRPRGKPRLSFILPAEEFAEGRIEGWLQALGPDGLPWPAPLPAARLTVTGPAVAEPATLRLTEGSSRFFLRTTGPGPVRVTARTAGATATGQLVLKPAIPKPQVLWEFETPKLGAGYKSDWTVVTDDTVRPNQFVAKIDFAGIPTEGDKRRAALIIEDFPPRDRLDRKGIRGAFLDATLSPGFRCADPNASIQVIMQSPDNWWMPLGSFKLSECATAWKTFTFPVTEEKHLVAMGNAFNLWLVLSANAPAHGALLVDHAGLLVR